MLNFLILYSFKYISVSALADRSTMKLKKSDIFYERNAFMIMQVFLNIGAFTGQASLFCFVSKRIDIFTWCSGIITIIFGYQTVYGVSIPVMSFIIMFLIGWLSGVSKCQGYYQLQENPDIKFENKEVAIVLASVIADIAIIISYTAAILVSVYLMPY